MRPRVAHAELTGAKGWRERSDRNPFASEFSAGLACFMFSFLKNTFDKKAQDLTCIVILGDMFDLNQTVEKS
jgi:hypothetical protein